MTLIVLWVSAMATIGEYNDTVTPTYSARVYRFFSGTLIRVSEKGQNELYYFCPAGTNRVYWVTDIAAFGPLLWLRQMKFHLLGQGPNGNWKPKCRLNPRDHNLEFLTPYGTRVSY